jgi:hypothetical protein
MAEPVKGSGSTAERPKTGAKPPPPPTYGLCDLPQNPDSFPSSPVTVEQDQCSWFQHYSAKSQTPTTGGSCGGFTVVFGQTGDLKPHLNRVNLKAEWDDEPLTAKNCVNASLAAVAWGERCSDDACTSANWEKIGGPKLSKGTWQGAQGCYFYSKFISINKKYRTLNLDIIASVIEDGKPVRKRAKGTIHVKRGNGKCVSVDQKPR